MNIQQLKVVLQQNPNFKLNDTDEELKVFSNDDKSPFWVLRKTDNAMDLSLEHYHDSILNLSNFFVTLGTTLMQGGNLSDKVAYDHLLPSTDVITFDKNLNVTIKDKAINNDLLDWYLMQRLMFDFTQDDTAKNDPILSVVGLSRAIEHKNDFHDLNPIQYADNKKDSDQSETNDLGNIDDIIKRNEKALHSSDSSEIGKN